MDVWQLISLYPLLTIQYSPTGTCWISESQLKSAPSPFGHKSYKSVLGKCFVSIKSYPSVFIYVDLSDSNGCWSVWISSLFAHTQFGGKLDANWFGRHLQLLAASQGDQGIDSHLIGAFEHCRCDHLPCSPSLAAPHKGHVCSDPFVRHSHLQEWHFSNYNIHLLY